MKYEKLISEMTLEEKASLCSGLNFWNTKPVERLGVPGMMLTDGPHGVRKQGGRADNLGLNASIPSTCYPTAAALANSWDEPLIEEMGRRLGLEAKSEGVGVLLGPGVNIKRSPLCGRNFEYFSEDPLLAGKCAAALIRGIQSQGVAACVKHFAVNSQELLRMTSDSVVDERSLREIYLPAFELAVKEGGVKCLMTSYNRLNGCHANENAHLLRDILCGDWGYRGIVVSDWGGSNDRVAGLMAGSHLEMPSSHGDTDRQIVRAVREDRLDEHVLDQSVDALLELVFSAAQTEHPGYDKAAHHLFARELAAECAVLLKNEGGILPLDRRRSVAVIGDFAGTPRYQGAGSSRISPTYLDDGLLCMRDAGFNIVGYARGFRRKGGRSGALLREACALAAKAETAVLWLGLDEGSEAEGIDRADMDMPENQLELLRAVRAVNPNIVVVLSCGSPVDLSWDRDCKALLYACLGGQAGAGAAADILCGKVCPSGKLAETFPLSLERVPCRPYFPGREATAEYREGLYVGYRYYDSAKVPVKYPFGFGLSYTGFRYGDLRVGGDGLVSFTVENVGTAEGAEIAQVYVSARIGGTFRPEQELRGFVRVRLLPGQKETVSVKLDERAFAYWNVNSSAWEIEGGAYQIRVGASSRDIRLTAEIYRAGSGAADPYADKVFAPYRRADAQRIPDAAFEALLGRKPPEKRWDVSAPLELDSAVAQGAYKSRGWPRCLFDAVELFRRSMLAAGQKETANSAMFVMNMPYRGIAHMAGLVSEAQMKALLMVANREKGGWRCLLRAEGLPKKSKTPRP